MKVSVPGLILFTAACFAATSPHCRVSYDNHLNGSRVDCEWLQLSDVPTGLPNDTKYLNLRNNDIKVLQNYSFHRLSQLLYIYLDSNQIWKLEPKVFAGLTQLKVLSLSDNNLKLDNITYTQDIFLPLHHLQNLDIGRNDGFIDGQIPDMIFSSLRNLQTLRIDTFDREVFGEGFSFLKKLAHLDIATGIKGDAYYCGLQLLSNTTFSNFKHTILSKLDMSGCEIYSIASGVLSPLKFISEINMENVKYVTTLPLLKAFSGLNGRNISKLLLSKSYHPPQVAHEIKGQVIFKESITTLSDLCIEYLDLSNNKIIYFDKEVVLLFSKCIKYMDLSKNNLLGSVLTFALAQSCNRLEVFDMSYQQNFQNHWNRPDFTRQLNKLPQNKLDNTNMTELISKSFRLTSYAFGNNQIDGISDMIFWAPPNIRVINLRSVTPHLGKFFITNIRNALHLTTLDVAYNSAWGLVHHIDGLQNVNILDLSGNEGYGMTTAFLASFPNLYHLSMNDMGFDEKTLLEGGHVLEGIRMSNISHLELAGNSIRFMAGSISPTLKVINLARNNFISLPINLCNSPNINAIDLSSNAITYFDGEEIAMLEAIGRSNKLSVNLSGNPISCSCNALSFVNWIFTSEVIFDQGGNYTCVTDNGTLSTTVTVFKQLNYNWTYCQGKIWLPISVALLFLLNLVVVSWILVTRNWTRIQHNLLVILGRGVQRVIRRDFDNDAYIAHSEEDGYFVRHIIMDSLQSLHLRLVLPDRDFLPGKYVADNVVESVNNSWKTVLIVTDSFLDDPWSYFIMRTVSFSVSYPNSNRVILLMIGDVNRGRLPESLLNVTEEEDILETDDFPGPKSKIWTEIRERILSEAP